MIQFAESAGFRLEGGGTIRKQRMTVLLQSWPLLIALGVSKITITLAVVAQRVEPIAEG